MRVTINMPESLVAMIDERDLGRGRSETITRLLTRYFKIVRFVMRTEQVTTDALNRIAAAVFDGIGEAEAETVADDLVFRVVLLDAAERRVVAERRAAP